jgi:hypothetical protein
VIDLGGEPRPGIELSLAVRAALDGEYPDPIVAFGVVGRLGWRQHLGGTAAVLGRVGAFELARCDGSSHLVHTGAELEAGAEFATAGVPAAIVGVDVPFMQPLGAWWFGISRTAHVDLRFVEGTFDAYQLGHSWGLDFPFPDCGWIFL